MNQAALKVSESKHLRRRRACSKRQDPIIMTRRRRPTEMFGKLLLALSLLFKVASSSSVVPEAPSGEPLIFALVPKQANNSFFDLSRDGCQARAALIGNIECLYVGPRDEGDAQAQADIIDELIARGDIDGISISVTDAAVASDAIARAMNADIPVVTFDSDAAQSERVAYVGTNNPAFGMELGKLLVQLKPLGGTFGIISSGAPNAMEKAQGARDRLQRTEWKEAQESPKDCQGSIDLFYQQMWEYAADPDIRAIIPTGAWPFLDPNTTRWKKFRDANPNITMVVSETLPITLQLMNEGYVDGIVGQLPYNMGELSVDTLLRIYEGEDVQEKIYGTSFMEVLLFPLELPPLVVDMNYLGYLVILGYFMFGLIVICSIAFATWTFINKDTRVVRASQPMFLGMICCGTLIMAASIIPLTVDDQRYSERGADIACMSVPWLISIGFTTTFSALFSKTWRVNKIFHNPRRFARIKVTAKDVIGPYLALLAINVIVLACWTAIAPLIYGRFEYPGTDSWNRPIASYGLCYSDSTARGGFVPYLVIIGVVNVGVLILANVQAYQARSIRTEFSESRYITIIMASMLQAFVIGLPVILLVWDTPEVYFVVMVCLISVICFAVLGFMFIPKVAILRQKRAEAKKTENRNSARRANGLVTVHGRDKSSTATSEEDDGRDGLKIAMLKSTRIAVSGIGTGGETEELQAIRTSQDPEEPPIQEVDDEILPTGTSKEEVEDVQPVRGSDEIKSSPYDDNDVE